MIDPLSQPIPLSVETKPKTPEGPRRRLLEPTDKPDEFIMMMDYSGMSEFMVCPRRAENKLVKGRELAKDQSATSFGRLFHKLTELNTLHGIGPEVKTRQTEIAARHFIDYPCAPTDHRTFEMMQSVIEGYNKRYVDDKWREMIYIYEGKPFVERPFKIELCTIPVNAYVPYPANMIVKGIEIAPSPQTFIGTIHVVLIGRIDLILEQVQNLWVVDRKTSSRGGNEFTEAFRLSLQTRGYAWAVWKITGRLPLGCIVDAAVVRKPTKTGKGTEFDRPTFFYSKDLIEEFEDNFKAHAADFIGNLVRGYWPQVSLSFKSPCPGCDYHDNCSLPRAQRAADLASDLYRDVTWNPLLEQ